ncbi:hypothetical protein [Microaceticoccus formicicus]|uniref:hypothetical protein n=1 Tax=Microaceticoccus formicicus TaxID=3118105 RepID=UPI003CD00C31|nr:hypothetical protein VZL98_03775 [Peptoniphilaceae bacterium AMB_02]
MKKYLIIITTLLLISLIVGCAIKFNPAELQKTDKVDEVSDEVKESDKKDEPEEIKEVDESYFTKPIISFMSGKKTIGSELDSGKGIYDLHIKGSGKLSITDASYNLVVEEVYPNVMGSTDYSVRLAIDKGYILDIGEGLIIDVYNAIPIESNSEIKLSTGYWLVGSDISEGKYSIKLSNVYGSNASISIYEDGELIDTSYYVKNDDNDAVADLNLLPNQVIVISGISEVSFTEKN